LKRAFLLQDIPFPRKEQRLPLILSQEEVARILTAPSHLKSRALLMTIYAAGLRRSDFATIVSALPLSSLITSAAGIKTQTGQSAEKNEIPASFVLKQEQRYIKIVYSQSSPASQSICRIGEPLKNGDNVAVAFSDVASTGTPESGTTDKNTDSITISGTIKLPKNLQPTPGQNASDAGNKTNAALPSKPDGSTDKSKQKDKK